MSLNFLFVLFVDNLAYNQVLYFCMTFLLEVIEIIKEKCIFFFKSVKCENNRCCDH